MKLFLALSCLQGRPSRDAVQELLELEPYGIQLTPGNYPDKEFYEWFTGLSVPYTLHHGFDWRKRRRRVWNEDLICDALPGASVHPPQFSSQENAEKVYKSGRVLEVMYAPYLLGDDLSLKHAMRRQLPLAVDTSHVALQLARGDTAESTWERLQHYGNIREVHVSQPVEGRDAHSPLRRDTFGLDWARQFDGPVVLECMMHRLSSEERKDQVRIIKDE